MNDTEEFETEFTCPLKARDPLPGCKPGTAMEVSGHVYYAGLVEMRRARERKDR